MAQRGLSFLGLPVSCRDLRSHGLQHQRSQWCAPRAGSLQRPARSDPDPPPAVSVQARRKSFSRKRGGPASKDGPQARRPPQGQKNSGNNSARAAPVQPALPLLSGLKKPPKRPEFPSHPHSDPEPTPYSNTKSLETHESNQNRPNNRLYERRTYLQCPECRTVYDVKAKDVCQDGCVIQCCICLHQWFSRQADLVENARDALALFSLPDYQKAAPLRERGQGTSPPSRRPVPLQETTSLSLFVGNLSLYANEQDLQRAFSAYGAVVRCDIPKGRGNQPRGYGFVEMRRVEDGLHAMQALQGVSIVGREILISKASRKGETDEDRDSTSSSETIDGTQARADAEEFVTDDEEFFDGDEDDEEEEASETSSRETGMGTPSHLDSK